MCETCFELIQSGAGGDAAGGAAVRAGPQPFIKKKDKTFLFWTPGGMKALPSPPRACVGPGVGAPVERAAGGGTGRI